MVKTKKTKTKKIKISELLNKGSRCFCRGYHHLDNDLRHCGRQINSLKEPIYFIYGDPMCQDCYIDCVKYGEVDINLEGLEVIDDITPKTHKGAIERLKKIYK